MVKMSERSKDFLQKHLPEALTADDPEDILDPLDLLIIKKGFIASQERCNDFGREAQEVYDDIFYSNYED